MIIEYWFGKEDEEDLFEYECDKQMICDAIYGEFRENPPNIVGELLDMIDEDDLFYEFYNLIKDYYEEDALSLWKELRG